MKHRPAYILFFLLAVMVLAVPVAGAGQTIVIDSNVNHIVRGNGTSPNGAGLPVEGDAEDYHVIVNNGGTADSDVYGGYARSTSGSATATGNTASISGTVKWGNVYGGYARSTSSSATATGNEVSINGKAAIDVHGGYASSDGAGSVTATDNSVTIDSGGTVNFSVEGGYAASNSGSATVMGNTVTISGTVAGEVRGGYAYGNSGSATATTTGNTVTITGTVGGDVYGGEAAVYSAGSATVTGNTVTINGTVGANVYGGYARSNSGSTTATATGNTVTINGGTVNGTVSGGLASGDSFTGNTLNLNSGTAIPTVRNFEIINFGNIGTAGITTLDATPTGAAGTLVKLNTDGHDVEFGGTISELGSAGGIEKTGTGTLTLSGTNTYSGGTTVSAGVLQIGDGGTTGSIAGNIINNANVTFNRSDAVAYAGAISGTGGLTKDGAGTLTLTGTNTYSGGTTVSEGTLSIAADGNIGTGTNTLSGGTLRLTGASYAKNWALGAGNNTIETPGDVTYAGVLSGTGFVKDGAGELTLSAANSFTGALAVNTGTVKLGTSATLAASSLSLGANTVFDYAAATAYTSSSPGALKSVTVSGLAASINAGGAGRTADFTGGTLHFIIPATAAADSVLLNVDGHATVAGATVSLDTPDGRPQINIGEKLILIDATQGVDGAPATTTQTAGGDTYSVKVDGDELQAVLEELSPTSPVVPVDPGSPASPGSPGTPGTPGVPGAPGGFSSLRLKAYAEGRAAGLAFVSQGLDFILNRGLGAAIAATAGPGLRLSAFGGTGGGDSRYRSGSHVDVRGMSFLAGLAVGNDTALGRATAAAFFEGGWGNYDSYNSFNNAASVAGHGGTSYTGGGVLGRYDVARGVFAGLYLDASARMGRTKTDFSTADIQYNGWKANFDSASLYYGLHAGLGYTRALTDKAVLDFSAKMLWTRQEGDAVTVYQDEVRFENADSLRTRLGGRFAYAVNDRVTPYAGAYWEHEFAGRLRGAVNGERLVPPSLRGDSGMAEVGFTYRPPGDRGLSVDVGVQGYAGKRAGVSGSLRVGWTF